MPASFTTITTKANFDDLNPTKAVLSYLMNTITTTTNNDFNTSISSTTTNQSMVGKTSLEETNPRLINGVVNLLLMLFNIGGNSLVLFIYHSLYMNTVFNLFVKVLVCLDLVTAMSTMMIDVMMKLRENNEDEFNTEAMCKLSHFQVYANSMVSGCVLTLIAYQRYRKICHPLQRTMRLKHAKIILIIISIASVILSIPTIFLYSSRHVKVLVRSTVVHATICRADQSYQNSPMLSVFHYLLIAAFCLVLGSVCVLYFMVYKSIRGFEKRSSAMFSSAPTSPTADLDTENEHENSGGRHLQQNSPMTDRTVVTSPVHGRPVKINDPFQNRRSPATAYSHTNAVAVRSLQPAASKKKDRFSSGRMSTFSTASSNNQISSQMYRVFSIITIVFIISYLPHLIALILTKVMKLDDKILPQGQRIALEFAYNCPYISTVSNPIIYGFSSSDFRDRAREMFQSCDICECICECCCSCKVCRSFDCCECGGCCDDCDGD